jgi:hypothetical protein
MAREYGATVPHTVAATPWEPEGLGNHRAVIMVNAPSDAVRATIPWRRRDSEPEGIAVRIFHGDEEIHDIAQHWVDRNVGALIFRAPEAGIYHAWYMPYTTHGSMWYFPEIKYTTWDEMTPDPVWTERNTGKWDELSLCRTLRIEARTEFDSFNPMEIVAMSDEADAVAKRANAPFAVYPEDRRNPIRMKDDLPLRWIQSGPSTSFRARCAPNEYYAFQIGVWALSDIDDLRVETTGPFAVTCFNTGGTDWLGRSFTKTVSITERRIQALWFGIDVPRGATGSHEFTVTLTANGHTEIVAVRLTITGKTLEDRGDGELWRHSRLRWLNSTIGIDDEPVEGFDPVDINGTTISVTGREVDAGENGLPSAIRSFFAPSVDRMQDTPVDILAAPMTFQVSTADGDVPIHTPPVDIADSTNAHAEWKTSSTGGSLDIQTDCRLEYDGHLDGCITITAREDVTLTDTRLDIPLTSESAQLMFGMGREGGPTPDEWDYRWELTTTNHVVWLGSVNAGLRCKLKHDEDVWDIYDQNDHGLPESWHNEGRGGARIEKRGDSVLLSAFGGQREMHTGESVRFRFTLLITPMKPIKPASHWQERYYHTGVTPPDISEGVEKGAKYLIIHQGAELNPNINYPFLTTDALRHYIDRANSHDLRVKIYHTVRELSNFATELWAFRSLGNEIMATGKGFALANQFEDNPDATLEQKNTGGPWLCEHVVDDFKPMWHQPLPNGHIDSAMATAGLSRFHNYYVESLGWLVRELGIDGIYLDGIGFDRQVMKRMRKALDAARPGCLIDFHSGNNYDKRYGLNNPGNMYMEHLPFCDSIWFGEMYDYDKNPDYWMVEVAGIPFGLMGEMLQDGGNPWRGMVFGMSTRLGWCGDPSPIWRLWDEFGMGDAQMLGYWVPDCPVATGRDNVLATVYVRDDSALVCIASWAEQTVDVTLDINADAFAFTPTTLDAPGIEDLQTAQALPLGEPITVEPGMGWMVILS